MYWSDVAQELQPYLWQGELDFCIKYVSGILRGLPNTPYHHILGAQFTNDPAEIASHFDQFVLDQTEHQLAAIYTETNGFYINPDRWYFDIYGYLAYGGDREDSGWYSWLARPISHYGFEVTLTGMEELQQIYREVADSGIYDSMDYGATSAAMQMRHANDFCDLLVVLRFQELIARSAAFMQVVEVPILATSHEYEFFFEVDPRNIRGSKLS
jgi:hypothetical protein